MSKEKYKIKNNLNINRENLDKNYVEPQMDEEKLKDYKKTQMLSKVNIENLDKNYEEPQIDEEKMKNNAPQKELYIDKKETKTNKPEIKKEGEKIKVPKSEKIRKEEEMMQCSHCNKVEDKNCNCPMNCDCKRSGKCKDNRNIKDFKDERYDPGPKRVEDTKSCKGNESEGVWDKTKNAISGGIEKAKDMLSKF